MRGPRRTRLVVALVALAAMSAACGVRYQDPEPGTEFFESLEIDGDTTPGGGLTMTVAITQTYSVEVQSVCELRQEKATLREIGRDLIPPHPEGSPEATPVSSAHSHNFSVDEPGKYFVECLTPLDEDNYIAKELIIE